MAKSKKMQEERWKTIKQVPAYEISNKGNIREKKSKEPIEPIDRPERGYYVLGYPDGKKTRYAAVHMLVAKAFKRNPEKRRYVRHINNDRYDNRIENLEWTNERKHSRKNSFINLEGERDVRIRLLRGETGASIALDYNTSEMSISRINRRLMRDLRRELEPMKKKRIITERTGNVKHITEVNWFDFVQETMEAQKELLSCSDFIDAAIDKYNLNITEVNRTNSSNQLTNVLQKLVKLGVFKKIHNKTKQRYYYGFHDWFTKAGKLKKAYEQRPGNSTIKRLTQLRKTKNGEYYQFIYQTMFDNNTPYSLNDFVLKGAKHYNIKEDDIVSFAKRISKVLRKLESLELIKGKKKQYDNITYYTLK